MKRAVRNRNIYNLSGEVRGATKELDKERLRKEVWYFFIAEVAGVTLTGRRRDRWIEYLRNVVQ